MPCCPAGVAICAVFSDPLVDALNSLSKALNIAPFFVAFALAPLASNASEMVSSLSFAAGKTRRNISLTFSQASPQTAPAWQNSVLSRVDFLQMSRPSMLHLSWSSLLRSEEFLSCFRSQAQSL